MLHPMVTYKLEGNSLRKAFADRFNEAFAKKMDRVLSQETKATPKHVAELLKLKDFPEKIRQEFQAAVFEGNTEAHEAIERSGMWKLLARSHELQGISLGTHVPFILEVERALDEPEKLATAGKFAELAETLTGHPLLSRFMWPDALQAIASATSAKTLLPAQASVMLEVQLSILVAQDLSSAHDAALPDILPGVAYENGNPTQLFFRYLLRESRCHSISELSDKLSSNWANQRNNSQDPPDHTSMLARWSAGTHHPNTDTVFAISRSIWGTEAYEPAWKRFHFANRLNFMGHLAEKLVALESSSALLRPWPDYPFGHATFEKWAAARYAYWHAFHCSRVASMQ